VQLVRMYVVRHCESLWNCASKEQRASGEGLRDARLSEVGIRQAEQLKKSIKDIAGQVKVVLSSPLTRALQTAEAISLGLGGVPIVILPALREVRRDVSDLGSPPEELAKAFDFSSINDLKAEWWLQQCEEHDVKVECSELHECGVCVAARIKTVREVMKCAEAEGRTSCACSARGGSPEQGIGFCARQSLVQGIGAKPQFQGAKPQFQSTAASKAIIMVSHSDFIRALCGRDLSNGEIVKLA